MTPTKLYNKQHDSYCTWNGTAYENDGKVPGAYFYGLEKAKNNGFLPVTNVQFYLATYEPYEADEQPTKEVLAVFVDEKKDYDLVSKEIYFDCYSRIGQHSICSESFLREKCKKITDQEQYLELYNELLNLEYNLNIV